MRPEFLMNVIGRGVDVVTFSDMRTALYDASMECQMAYTTLMNSNIQKHEIAGVQCDGGAVAVRTSSRTAAKRIGDRCVDRVLRRGDDRYDMSVKVRDEYVIVSCSKQERNDDNEDQ